MTKQFITDIVVMYEMAHQLSPKKFSYKPLNSFFWGQIGPANFKAGLQDIGYALPSLSQVPPPTLFEYILSVWSLDLINELLRALLQILEFQYDESKSLEKVDKKKRYPAIDFVRSWKNKKGIQTELQWMQIKCIRHNRNKPKKRLCFTAALHWIYYWKTIDSNLFRYIPKCFILEHPDILLRGLLHNVYHFGHMPETTQLKHWNFISQVIQKNNINTLDSIHPSVCMQYPFIAISIILKDTSELTKLPDEVLSRHPQIALQAIQKATDSIQYLSEQYLLQNPSIARTAVKRNAFTIRHIPTLVIMQKPELAFIAVKKHEWLVKYIPEELLRMFPEIMKMVLKRRRSDLRTLTSEFDNDKVKMKKRKID